MKTITLFLALVLTANAVPSKQAESDSVEIAHRELQRMTGLNTKEQYDRFSCEFWFYESFDDPTNFARLKEEEKNELKKLVGSRSFFLHRYTSKNRSEVFEVIIGDDGKTVLGAQKRPNKASEPTAMTRPPSATIPAPLAHL